MKVEVLETVVSHLSLIWAVLEIFCKGGVPVQFDRDSLLSWPIGVRCLFSVNVMLVRMLAVHVVRSSSFQFSF